MPGKSRLEAKSTGIASKEGFAAEGFFSPTNTSAALWGRSSGVALRQREIIFAQRCGRPRNVVRVLATMRSERVEVVTLVFECESVEIVYCERNPATMS